MPVELQDSCLNYLIYELFKFHGVCNLKLLVIHAYICKPSVWVDWKQCQDTCTLTFLTLLFFKERFLAGLSI